MSLMRTVSKSIIWIAIFFFCIQVVGAFYECFSDTNYYVRIFIDEEVRRLGGSLLKVDGRVDISPDLIPFQYNGPHKYVYAFRITDTNGRVLASSNSQLVENAFPIGSQSIPRTLQWSRSLETGGWFHVAGGAPFKLGDDETMIDIATVGDPALQRFRALAHDVLRQVLPTLPLVALIFGLTLLGLRRALRPLEAAVAQVEAIDGSNDHLTISHEQFPKEVQTLTRAIDRLLQRNKALLSTQQRLVAHSAHELRTPLAMMLLDLGRSKDPSAPRLIEDVRLMTETVNRLLAWARLEMMQVCPDKDVDLVDVATRVIRSSDALIRARKCQIELTIDDPSGFKGDPTSVFDATRNLLENALKHAPEASVIRICCGPGASLRVEDSGTGMPDMPIEALFTPFTKGDPASDGTGLGLAIVQKAVELHRGVIRVQRSSLGGADIEMRFSPLSH